MTEGSKAHDTPSMEALCSSPYHYYETLIEDIQKFSVEEVIVTRNLTELLTLSQLGLEIKEQIKLHSGRIRIEKLQIILNVDLDVILRILKNRDKHGIPPNDEPIDLCAGDAKDASLLQLHIISNEEEIVTDCYLEHMIEDVNRLLEETGCVSIAELAQVYRFSIEYMKQVLLDNLDPASVLFDRNVVQHRDTFLQLQKAKLRGTFFTASQPILISSLARELKMDEKLVHEYLRQLLYDEKKLSGALKGSEFVPQVFIDMQRTQMYNFFRDNGYIEHSRSSQLQVQKPFEYIKKEFPDAVALQDSVVSQSLILQAEAAAESAVYDKWFVDLQSVLPEALSARDCEFILGKISKQADAVSIGDRYAVSKVFLQFIESSVKEDAEKKAHAASNRGTIVSTESLICAAGGSMIFEKDSSAKPNTDSESRKSRRGKRNGAHDETLPDHIETNSKRKSSQPAEVAFSKRDKKISRRSCDDQLDTTLKIVSHKTITPNETEFVKMACTWENRLEDEEDVVRAIFIHLGSRIDSVYRKALDQSSSSDFRGDAVTIRNIRAKFEEKFDDIYSKLSIFDLSLHKLKSHSSASDSYLEESKHIHSYILDTHAVNLSLLVTSFVATLHNLDLDGISNFSVVEESFEPGKEKLNKLDLLCVRSDHNKTLFEKKLGSFGSSIVKLWTLSTAGRRHFGDFMHHLPTVINALSIPPRKLDRRKKRQIVFCYRNDMIARLGNLIKRNPFSTYPIVSAVLQLLFQNVSGLWITLPEQSLAYAPLMMSYLCSALDTTIASDLQKFIQLASDLQAQDTPEDIKKQYMQMLLEMKAIIIRKESN